jgi:hypothetical protein
MMLTTYFQASDFSINVDHILKNIAIFLIDDVDHMTWGLLENVSNPPSHDGLTHSSVRPTTWVASWGVWASCRVMPGAFAEQMNI